MRKAVAVLAIVVGALLVIGLFWWINREDNLEDQAVFGSTIVYRDSGFSPQVLRTLSGTLITVENESSRNLEFSSDPHPSHTGNPELNADAVEPGEEITFTVTRGGTWGYHDHLNPSYRGHIIVD